MRLVPVAHLVFDEAVVGLFVGGELGPKEDGQFGDAGAWVSV